LQDVLNSEGDTSSLQSWHPFGIFSDKSAHFAHVCIPSIACHKRVKYIP
jgi:hypothetical protein